MSAPRILLLAAEPGIALQVLFCVEAMGASVHLAAARRASHLKWAKACATYTHYEMQDSWDAATLAGRLDALARQCAVDLIVPSDMASTRHLVDIKSSLTTPTIPLPAARLFKTLDDKFTFAEMLTDLGCKTPRTVYVGRPQQISISLLEREIGFPLVIKPTDQGNSNGVVICRDVDDVINRITENANYPYQSLIAQEYIPGFDIDLSVMAIEGRVVASAVQRRIGREIQFLDEPEFLKAGTDIIAATGYSGPAHFDGRYDERDGTIKFVECNPRFWASITASLYCGVNFVGEAITAAGTIPRATPVTVPAARFMPPTPLAVKVLSNPCDRALWTAPNVAGLRQTWRNVVPYLAEEWQARRRQIVERQRLGGAPATAPNFRLVKG